MQDHKLNIIGLMALLCVSCSSAPTGEEAVIADAATHPNFQTFPYESNAKDKKPMPDSAKFRPVRLTNTLPLDVPSGSLFNSRRAIGLYQPGSQYTVGDMILIKLKENTSAKKSIDFKTDKKSQFTLEPVSFNAGALSLGQNSLNAEFEQENDFDSSSQTKQDNSLNGDITVYVMDIMDNGNLIVAGEKWISLNQGEEYIRFSGEIRVQDIAKDNTIPSVKVGNARIEYGGKGKAHDNQEKSIIGKLFSILE